MSEPFEGVEGDIEESAPSTSVPPSDNASFASNTEPLASAENVEDTNSPQESDQERVEEEMKCEPQKTKSEHQGAEDNEVTEADAQTVVEQQETNLQSPLENSESKASSAEGLGSVEDESSNVEAKHPATAASEAAQSQLSSEEAHTRTNEEAQMQGNEDTQNQASEEAENQAKEEAEKHVNEEAEKQAKEAAEKQANEEAEKQANEEAEKQANEEAQRQVNEQAQRQANEEAQRQANEQAQRQANEEAQRQANEQAQRQANEEAQRQANEQAQRQANEEAQNQANEQAQRQVNEQAQRQANEQAQRQANEQAQRQANEEAQRQANEEAQRQANEQAQRQANEEAQKQANEQAQRQANEQAQRQANEQAQKQATPSAVPQPPNAESEVLDQESDGSHSEVGSSIAEDGVSLNRVSSQASFDATQLQQQALEATIVRLRREVNESRARLTEHDASAKRTIMTMQNDMRARLDNLGRLCEENRREKEAMVLKYAQAEQKTMDVQKRVRDLEGRLREAQREKEGLTKQSRILRQEKERVQGLYENKCTEMANLEKELLVAKDASSTIDMKVKWHQNKLKEEQERHKETQKTLSNLREETETIRANCQQIIKKYQETEEARSSSLKQAQAENHVQQEVHQKAVKELETVRKSARESTGEVRTLRDKVKCLEAERMCVEEAATQAKERALRMKTQRDGLAEKLRALESAAADAAEKATQLEAATTELSAARQARQELEADTERARGRETELLEFTQRLSDRNAALQAENLTQRTALDEAVSDVRALSDDLQAARVRAQQQEQRLGELEAARAREAEETGRLLADKTASCEQLTVMLADERNEIRTLKKKHAANSKDLTRQLAALRKKLDTSPIGLPLPENGEPHASPSSSTSSLDINAAAAPAICVDGPQFPAADPEIKMIMPDRQALIDKIVRLQRTNARHNEKIDFLAEHVNQLTDQLKRKNRLLQHFILREEAGSVTPEDFDLNKAALARKGGIMASVYSSHAADQGMTLDLSLEITRKLQAVLEDTLLKNITLKDNLNTLGEEISRLSRENREMQLGSQG